VIWEWHHKTPIIEVRLFKNFNFATANVMTFIFGVLLFRSLLMMPQFLQTVLGYTAENAGLLLPGGGLVVLLEMPIVGRLAGKYPAKYINRVRLAPALGMYVSTVQLDTLISFQSAAVLRVMQSVGLGLLFVPVTMGGYIGMPAEKAKSVAGIVNFMRNIGSSVGTSLVRHGWRGARKFTRWCSRSIPLRSIRLFRTKSKL
jgi:MFS transporter, DHA2 family, multidrug resistance protein